MCNCHITVIKSMLNIATREHGFLMTVLIIIKDQVVQYKGTYCSFSTSIDNKLYLCFAFKFHYCDKSNVGLYNVPL